VELGVGEGVLVVLEVFPIGLLSGVEAAQVFFDVGVAVAGGVFGGEIGVVEVEVVLDLPPIRDAVVLGGEGLVAADFGLERVGGIAGDFRGRGRGGVGGGRNVGGL
jgi:hypothetical protein